MITIHKHPLDNFGEVRLPSKHEFLTVQMQNNKATFWFKVDTDSNECVKSYVLYGTGWEINEYDSTNEEYIATVQDTDGFVWHIFEKV